jgi:hypothetical protein
MMGSFAVRLFAAGFLLALLGCSTGTGGTGSTSGGGTCESACNHVASVPCIDQDGGVPACVSQCEAEISSSAQCASQTQAYLECVSTATITCDANGVPNVSTVCATQSRAYSMCAACLPASTDDACDTCSKSSCCTEWRALVGDPHLFDYSDCISACPDIACFDGCDAQYPSVLQNSQNYATCQSTNCAADCGP